MPAQPHWHQLHNLLLYPLHHDMPQGHTPGCLLPRCPTLAPLLTPSCPPPHLLPCREACGYMGLEDWEAAAGSLYEGLAHDPENSEMLRLFKVCIENGQKVFKAKQAEQQRAMAEAVAAAEAAAAAAGAAR